MIPQKPVRFMAVAKREARLYIIPLSLAASRERTLVFGQQA